MIDQLILQLQDVSKAFPRLSIPAVDQVSLKLPTGSILGLLGPSGCGKTTLLRLIAGFERPDSGVIKLNGQQVADGYGCLAPERRAIGMVFQDFALFPHLTVAQNIGFGLTTSKLYRTKVSRRERVAEVLDLVRLQGLETRFPHELSGGQQQRVALARAIAPNPTLVLLDEPLSNLDAQVRVQLREELREILKESGSTAVFVTHDQEEAMSMSDQLAVMRNGKLEQFGSPESIYLTPTTPFVAEFVSQANFVEAHLSQNGWRTEIGDFPCQDKSAKRQTSSTEKNEAVLMIREEDLLLEPDSSSSIQICDRQFLGREYRYCLKTASGKELHARSTDINAWPIGTSVKLKVLEQAMHIFQSSSSK